MLLKSLLVYSKSNCGICKNFINSAKQMHIPIVTIDIEQDTEAGVNLVEILKADPTTIGYKSLPIIEVTTAVNGNGPYEKKYYDLQTFNKVFNGLVGFLAQSIREADSGEK